MFEGFSRYYNDIRIQSIIAEIEASGENTSEDGRDRFLFAHEDLYLLEGWSKDVYFTSIEFKIKTIVLGMVVLSQSRFD